ncbi:MAG: hypothetical protein IJ779_06050 [Ruminococcus sp.]|nr:hypothetical protein [Ruminococcus sp.]
MSEFNSKGTVLSVAPIPTTGEPTYKKLYGLSNVPEMGGTPEQIDVTNLEDGIKRSILGIQDTGTLDFEFFAAEGETDTTTQIRDTWNILRAYQTAGTKLRWKLEYPDGEGFVWDGTCSVRRQAVAVNQAIKFTLTVGLDSALTDI